MINLFAVVLAMIITTGNIHGLLMPHSNSAFYIIVMWMWHFSVVHSTQKFRFYTLHLYTILLHCPHDKNFTCNWPSRNLQSLATEASIIVVLSISQTCNGPNLREGSSVVILQKREPRQKKPPENLLFPNICMSSIFLHIPVSLLAIGKTFWCSYLCFC